MALELSAVEVVRRETDQSGDLFSTKLAEFRQRSEERKGQGWTDTRHGDEQAISVGELGIGSDKFCQTLIEEKYFGLQAGQRRLLRRRSMASSR